MNKVKDVLIMIGAILTLPIWVIALFIILLSIPKDYYEQMDELDADQWYI